MRFVSDCEPAFSIMKCIIPVIETKMLFILHWRLDTLGKPGNDGAGLRNLETVTRLPASKLKVLTCRGSEGCPQHESSIGCTGKGR